LEILNGRDISKESINYFDKSDFFNFFDGKIISIVGPAPAEAFDAKEIDSSDLVVRLNHSYERKGTDPNHKGLRTDITCFNGEAAERFMHQRKGKLPQEVTWACFKSPGLVDSVKAKNKGKFVRSHILFNQPKFHGNFNMLPIVALDFAIFSANPLKIYHSDLMLTIVRQKGYYPKDIDRPDDAASIQKNFRRSSVVHDPIQQYRTLHTLWQNKKISGDARFTEVMEMELDGYLSELERVYTQID
jgi:hypothetical protein